MKGCVSLRRFVDNPWKEVPTAAWKAWHERWQAAQSRGEPFDEPPPEAEASMPGNRSRGSATRPRLPQRPGPSGQS